MPLTNAGPPPAKGTAAKPATTKATPQSITAQRMEALSNLATFATVPLMAMKLYADVGAVSLHWPNVSKEIAELAGKNEQIARLVDPLMQIGPYAGLITAILPFAMQIGVNHGRLQPGAMNTVPPTALSAQVETAMAKTELEALTIQRDAELAAAALRREIADSRRALTDAMRDNQEVATNGR